MSFLPPIELCLPSQLLDLELFPQPANYDSIHDATVFYPTSAGDGSHSSESGSRYRGSPIRQKGRSFFLKTNHVFLYEIMEEMASCINDSQWRIGAFLTNSCSSPKKIRSRKKKINLGLNQEPDCVVILDADRKSSVILEADRSQIPIASLVDSTIPLGSFKRITYPIPANDPIQFVYLFRHSITKTVILERGRIVAMKEKKELIDRPFPRRIGFSRSVEWSPASETSLWIEQE
ncbi:ribosomal protein S2, mitochondrial-like [Ananas comosus]|uniref:Ribosomal protein S2, mitochondrial-like n=1 Tax=Ananas comosus TaxID=4615 RepID=A0A6P5FK31_ANACO|nr:ribosomal protein S2, mitochondrial-like [Ananas comosus]